MNLSLSNHNKEQDFKQLYEEYYAPFCLYAKRFVDDKVIREDIVSDVFISLWDKMGTSELNTEALLGYIKTSVRNSCFNYLKHQEHEWNYIEMMYKRVPVYETEPDSIYTLNELYRILYETLDKLPEHYRTVFIKSFFSGKTQNEIAEELNISVKSVNRYKQKTIELLRLSLKEYLPLVELLLIWNRLQ